LSRKFRNRQPKHAAARIGKEGRDHPRVGARSRDRCPGLYRQVEAASAGSLPRRRSAPNRRAAAWGATWWLPVWWRGHSMADRSRACRTVLCQARLALAAARRRGGAGIGCCRMGRDIPGLLACRAMRPSYMSQG